MVRPFSPFSRAGCWLQAPHLLKRFFVLFFTKWQEIMSSSQTLEIGRAT
ncbi:MAG TPA: glutamate 5-kinase, partial [Erwinia persicina]|nr:glutamate 5-kinase [Erwinia persicina]